MDIHRSQIVHWIRDFLLLELRLALDEFKERFGMPLSFVGQAMHTASCPAMLNVAEFSLGILTIRGLRNIFRAMTVVTYPTAIDRFLGTLSVVNSELAKTHVIDHSNDSRRELLGMGCHVAYDSVNLNDLAQVLRNENCRLL